MFIFLIFSYIFISLSFFFLFLKEIEDECDHRVIARKKKKKKKKIEEGKTNKEKMLGSLRFPFVACTSDVTGFLKGIHRRRPFTPLYFSPFSFYMYCPYTS